MIIIISQGSSWWPHLLGGVLQTIYKIAHGLSFTLFNVLLTVPGYLGRGSSHGRGKRFLSSL
jgi:hypothetical protein